MANEYIFCIEDDPLTENWEFYKELEFLARVVATSSNFTYTANTIVGGMWTKLLLSEECDIAIGFFSIHPQLALTFRYGTFFEMSTVHILSGKIKQRATFSTLDLDYKMLFAAFITIAVLGILSTVAERLISKIRFLQKRKTDLTETFWMYYGSLFLQGFRKQVSLSSNILIAAWSFTLIIILSVIGGSMKADLTTSQEFTLETIQDIVNHPEITPIVPMNTAVSRLIMNSPNDVTKLLAKRISATGGERRSGGLYLLIPHLVKGKCLLVQDRFYTLEFLIHHQKKGYEGKFRLSTDSLFSLSNHIFTHDGVSDEIMEKINQKSLLFASTVQMMPRHRSMLLLVDRYLARSDHHFENDISFLVYVYLVGIAFSSIVFLLEIAVRKVNLSIEQFGGL